jgi:release factor glutamine methyltransferase
VSRSVADALAHARAAGLDRVDAFALLGHLLQRDRAWLLTHDDATLSPELEAAWTVLCRRRADGEPVAYLVGRREFHGLDLQVGPGVLVPRPDTETLVDWALALLGGELAARPQPRVLDLGTGSGAIALAVKHARPGAAVTAVDASADALAQAGANGERLGLTVRWLISDWWQALAGEHFDLVLSNPPYIAADDPHLAALRHEPLRALTPGGDGLGDIRRIVAEAPAHLADGAWLLFEHGWDQAAQVARLLAQAGFEAVAHQHDLAGQVRCTGGRWRSRNGPL